MVILLDLKPDIQMEKRKSEREGQKARELGIGTETGVMYCIYISKKIVVKIWIERKKM